MEVQPMSNEARLLAYLLRMLWAKPPTGPLWQELKEFCLISPSGIWFNGKALRGSAQVYMSEYGDWLTPKKMPNTAIQLYGSGLRIAVCDGKGASGRGHSYSWYQYVPEGGRAIRPDNCRPKHSLDLF
jgi:hypothetical protein